MSDETQGGGGAGQWGRGPQLASVQRRMPPHAAKVAQPREASIRPSVTRAPHTATVQRQTPPHAAKPMLPRVQGDAQRAPPREGRVGGSVINPMLSSTYYSVAKIEQEKKFDCAYASISMILKYHGIEIPKNSALEKFKQGNDVQLGEEELINISTELGLVVLFLHEGCDSYVPGDLKRILDAYGPIAAGLCFGRKDRNAEHHGRKHMVVIDGIKDVYVSCVDPVPDKFSPMQGIGFQTLLNEVAYFCVVIPRNRQDLLSKWAGKLARLRCSSPSCKEIHQTGW